MSENLIGMMKAPAFAGAFVYVGGVEAVSLLCGEPSLLKSLIFRLTSKLGNATMITRKLGKETAI